MIKRPRRKGLRSNCNRYGQTGIEGRDDSDIHRVDGRSRHHGRYGGRTHLASRPAKHDRGAGGIAEMIKPDTKKPNSTFMLRRPLINPKPRTSFLRRFLPLLLMRGLLLETGKTRSTASDHRKFSSHTAWYAVFQRISLTYPPIKWGVCG